MTLFRSICITAVAVALAPQYADAQARTTFAVDMTAGASYGMGGEYFDRDLTGARLAASVRRTRPAQFDYFGEVAIDWLAISSGHAAVGYPSSRGGFKDSYPEFLGPTAVVGLVAGSTSRVETRVGVGVGAYESDGPRVGAALSQLDVALFPVAHVGIVAGARWIVVPRYRGDQLSMIPWMIGLRLR